MKKNNFKETNIPCLSKEEEAEISRIKKEVVLHLDGLRKVTKDLCALTQKPSGNQELNDFYTWLYRCKLDWLDTKKPKASLIDEVQLTFEDIFNDFQERTEFQKVYQEPHNGLDFDYAYKKDLLSDGFSKCPTCGVWLFSDDTFCPFCDVPYDLSPYKSKTGITIDPLLMDFKDVERIFCKGKRATENKEADNVSDTLVNFVDWLIENSGLYEAFKIYAMCFHLCACKRNPFQ